MEEVFKFDNNLSVFQNVIVLYKDEAGKRYIGNVYYYNGRGGKDYLGVFCKDALPENLGVIMGWNWLDDNSPNIILVPEDTMETGVEDFLFAHGKERKWNSVEYHVIDSFGDIDEYEEKNPLKNGEVIGFGIKK